MQTAHESMKALANTIRKSSVFGLLSSSDNRSLKWAEKCADRAISHDFSRLSDRQLRNEFYASNELARTLSIASTTVNRRLGVWQIFEMSAEFEDFARFHDIADQVIETAHFSDSIKYFTEPDFSDTPAFEEMLGRSLDDNGLIGQYRAIVRGLVFAAERRKTALPEHISLSADFYKAIAELDERHKLKFTPTRQQVIAAALLTRGIIVEMDAGEGKTISTVLAVLAYAAQGSRVHVLTSNDYLAQRDAEWLEPVYESLGVSVAPVISPMDEDERRMAYARTVVYSTVREVGFDFLKDNLKLPPDKPIQFGIENAIVDEADHVLIDQHRTPLIISGNETADIATVEKSHGVIRQLLDLHSRQVAQAEQELNSGACPDDDAELAMLYAANPDNDTLKRITTQRGDSRQRLLTELADIEDTASAQDFENRYYYRVDSHTRTVRLTERGEACIDASLGTANSDRRWAAHSQAHQFLRAYTLFTRDVDYIVDDDGVVLVDPFNGRLLPDNRYLHGLQIALEAKEGLPPTPDAETLAQITIPGLMGRYQQVSGLSGTAIEAQDDFLRDYGLPVVRIEPSEPSHRTEFPPEIHNNTEAQHSAILAEVEHWHSLGRPVLIGTTSVVESEDISSLLRDNDVPHNLLNAVNSEREAQIIRDAGEFGAVTVATNMAGRGTDILLKPDLNQRILRAAKSMVSNQPRSNFSIDCATSAEASLLAHELDTSDKFEISLTGVATVEVKPMCSYLAPENKKSFGLGLCVIGVSLNGSSRIDRQLKGRAGRQGAFGASKLIVSSQDDPIAFSRQANSIRSANATNTRRVPILVQSIQSESDADERWRSALSRDYSSVVETQTLSFYHWRRELLASNVWRQSRSDSVVSWAIEFISSEFDSISETGYETVFDQIQSQLWTNIGIDCEWMYGLGKTELSAQLAATVLDAVDDISRQFEYEEFDHLARNAQVETADKLWPQHLNHLQDVALSCAIAGPTHRAAVGEFIEQAHSSFQAFLDDVNREVVPSILALDTAGERRNQTEQPIVIGNEILSVLA